MRTFVAVEVAESVREQVNSKIKDFRALTLPIKWVSFDNLHITLKFLGEITREKQQEVESLLEETVQGHVPFPTVLHDFGCFPNPRNPRVLWVGVEKGSEELYAFAHDIDAVLSRYGFTKEKRFHPHLTIGRIKKPCSLESILKQGFTTSPFEVNAIALFKSTLTPQGAIYENLKSFRFSGTANSKHQAVY